MAQETSAGRAVEQKRAHSHPNYMAIFWWLLALTVVELAVPTLLRGAEGFAFGVKVASLVVLAGAKVALVAMYFMHLRFESRTLALIAGTPIVLCVLLLLMLLPDAI
ncbi:MAG: cytochrome C oxidase subunit IV family protein [Acidobacteriota bacterium]